MLNYVSQLQDKAVKDWQDAVTASEATLQALETAEATWKAKDEAVETKKKELDSKTEYNDKLEAQKQLDAAKDEARAADTAYVTAKWEDSQSVRLVE